MMIPPHPAPNCEDCKAARMRDAEELASRSRSRRTVEEFVQLAELAGTGWCDKHGPKGLSLLS